MNPLHTIASGLVVVVLLGWAPSSASAQRGPQPNTSTRALRLRCEEAREERDQTCTMYGPSLMELIVNPTLWDSKPVRVVGYVRLEFEGDAIYFSREDLEHGMPRNALWLSLPDSLRPKTPWKDGYYIVEGTFDAEDNGHMGMFSGALRDISRFDRWEATDSPPPAQPATDPEKPAEPNTGFLRMQG